MGFEMFYEDYGYPLRGNKLQKLKEFLLKEGLDYDDGIKFTINLCDSRGNIAATGSLEDNILKCIAVSDLYQGEGLSARIVSSLVSHGVNNGHSHLFLFTKPDNINIFSDLGFYLIAQTSNAALMENKKNGIKDYVSSLKFPNNIGEYNVGAIILNCNPFTKGHLYLIETAAKECHILHLFVVSENKSIFPASDRYNLVKDGVRHLSNVFVHPTSNYLISSVTFPTYFIKDKYRAGEINCLLDLTIFCKYFAKILKIKKRFVGTEPYDKVTASYNSQMKSVLGECGIEVIEIQRHEENNIPISASRVRKLMIEGDYETINKIVPEVTYNYLISEKGMKIAEKLRRKNE